MQKILNKLNIENYWSIGWKMSVLINMNFLSLNLIIVDLGLSIISN